MTNETWNARKNSIEDDLRSASLALFEHTSADTLCVRLGPPHQDFFAVAGSLPTIQDIASVVAADPSNASVRHFPALRLNSPLQDRMRWAIRMAWTSLGCRIAGGAVKVFKEASAQLHFAQMLQGLLPLIQYKESERLWIDLERTVRIEEREFYEIDVLLHGADGDWTHTIAIEMKAYRKKAASDKNRGATDIFRKDVYDDLGTLEKYIRAGHADRGVCLVLTDHQTLVEPRPYPATEKWWHYDIAEGVVCQGPVTKNIPVGGKEVSIVLQRRYQFHWTNVGAFWLADIEGQ